MIYLTNKIFIIKIKECVIMIDESKKREKLKFTEIEKLSQPIKLPDRYLLSGEIGFFKFLID